MLALTKQAAMLRTAGGEGQWAGCPTAREKLGPRSGSLPGAKCPHNLSELGRGPRASEKTAALANPLTAAVQSLQLSCAMEQSVGAAAGGRVCGDIMARGEVTDAIER